MFAYDAENKYFNDHLDKTHKVLEWGSGISTMGIADQVDFLVSVEHDVEWYEKIKNDMSLSKKSYDNCKYLFKPPSVGGAGEKSDEENKYIDFKEYVDAPIGYGPFDIILIDGRARVACASKCHLLGHKNTIVFIHDFTTPDSPYYNPTRDYYVKSLEYLEYIENTMTMAKFKIKNL
jgi:hypothetical protein|tara:strand:+ start:1504 stop:2034 length:531 start_codon:yes stop_codon:yes gene_type:complete